jgi:RimJ/RimL family protein N-acetyltransferase
MSLPVTLTTDRLRLRPFTDGDLPPFAALNADPAIRRYYPTRLTREQSDQLAMTLRQQMSERGWGMWVVDSGEQDFCGIVGLSSPDYETPFTPCVEIGWMLARDQWGRGYATEAAHAVLRFAFVTLGLDDVVSFTTHANQRSRAVMQRLGMTRDFRGDFDHPRVPLGHPYRPHVLYRLPRARWALLHAGRAKP